jgi:hypothetical protein
VLSLSKRFAWQYTLLKQVLQSFFAIMDVFVIYFSLFLCRDTMQECSTGYYSLGFSVTCFICPAGSKCPAKNVSSFEFFYY